MIKFFKTIQTKTKKMNLTTIECDLDFLCRDVIQYIIENFLHDKDKFAFRQTCKKYNSYVCLSLKTITLNIFNSAKINAGFLSQFPNLTTLTIQQHPLLSGKISTKTSVFNFPSSMKSVKILKISKFEINKNELLKFENLESIFFLQTSGKEIFHVAALKNLQKIGLNFPTNVTLENCNEKFEFPFQNLKFFRVSREYNQLSPLYNDICETFQKLIHVEHLMIHDGSLISKNFTLLENLISLEIHGNMWSNFPVSKLRSLKNLYCFDMNFENFSKLPCGLETLIVTFISGIENYQDEKFDNLSNLKTLTISEDCIILDKVIESMSKLEVLNCPNSYVKNVSCLNRLIFLKDIRLCFNEDMLSELNSNEIKCKTLTILEVYYINDPLNCSIQIFSKFKNLTCLSIPHLLQESKWDCLPHTLKNLSATGIPLHALYDMKESKLLLESLKLTVIQSNKEKWDIYDIHQCFKDSLQSLTLRVYDEHQQKIIKDITMEDLLQFSNLNTISVYPSVLAIKNFNQKRILEKHKHRKEQFSLKKIKS